MSTSRRRSPHRAEAWIRDSILGPGDTSTPLHIELFDVIPWVMSSTVAERFVHACAFLIGDAAHQLPPSGGFGMNTAVQDAHNLAWKLAFVLRGRADPTLLDTYETERAPIARHNADRSLENTRKVGRIRKLVESGDDPAEVTRAVSESGRYGNWLGMDLGLRYEDGCVIADGSAPPAVADPVSDYVDTGRPGHRAPHFDLADGTSSLDLYDLTPTVVAGHRVPHDSIRAWLAGRAISLRVHQLDAPRPGKVDPHHLHGIAADGAVLVRPDGHVAWRAVEGPDDAQLSDAITALGLAPR